MVRFVYISIILLVFIIGCGSKSSVILLSNPDGTVGEIDVASEKGSQRLTKANQITRIKNPKAVPSTPEILSDDEIQRKFKEVLSIQPLAPHKFILYFEFNSNNLTPESINLLSEIIKTINTRKSSDIFISGHSDRVGDKEYNIKLSLARAQKVSGMLVSMGINPEYFDVSSHGEGNPIIKTADNVAEPKNRRVEVTVR